MLIRHQLSTACKKAPDSVAIAAPGRSPLTYSQLDSQINYVIAALRSFGIGPNDRVATVLPPGPEAAVAVLAGLCGTACAPLDPRCGPDELATSLSELGATAVMVSSATDSPAINLARRAGIALVELTPAPGGEAGLFTLSGTVCARENGDDGASARTMALVLRTSGTTARPKFVPLTDANLCASAVRVRAALNLASRDCYLNVTPPFYSQGVMLTLASLCAGSSIVSTPGFDSGTFFDWLDEFRPTWYSAAPAVHHAIIAHARATRISGPNHRLRFVRSAAAPLPTPVREGLEELFRAPVIEAYGMTECYPIAVNPFPPCVQKPGSAGVPAGTEIAILNEAGDHVTMGATGEIAVRGPHVTPGYLHQTKAGGDRAAPGWFRTGDLGHVDADGYLFVTGRMNETINRGGEKISPEEVDEVLTNHPDVEEAGTFSVPHITLGEDVAAAVVLRSGASVAEDDIRAFVAARLTPFKVPRQVIFVTQLPKNATGKIRRRELREMLGPKAIAPSPELEHATEFQSSAQVRQSLVQIWIQLLGITSIGMHENFFLLGGNSLLAMQMVGEIERVFGRRLPLQVVLQKPTVEQLAAALSQDDSPEPWSALMPVQPLGSRPPLFWVHGDASTGFLTSFLGPDQPLYGLEHQSGDGKPAQYQTVEEIASHYLREVEHVQSKGPFFIGGFSFGGTVAFEMAQQLRRRGEPVGLLILLDSHFPGADAAQAAAEETREPLRSEVGRHIRTVTSLDIRALWRYVWVRLKARALHHANTCMKLCKSVYCELVVRTGRPIPRSILSHYLIRIYLKARDRYDARPYDGRVVYVKSEQRANYHRTRWAGIVDAGLESFEVSGDHLDVIALPHARQWAGQLKGWLETAHARSAEPQPTARLDGNGGLSKQLVPARASQLRQVPT